MLSDLFHYTLIWHRAIFSAHLRTNYRSLSAGDSTEEVLQQFPSLEAEDIRACLTFAARLMDHKYEVRQIA